MYSVRDIDGVNQYMNSLKRSILNMDSVSSIIYALVNNRPVSHFTAQQNTQIGEYLRDLITSKIEKIGEEDQILSERVRRSNESDNLLPSIIYGIINPKPRDYHDRHVEEPRTHFEVYLRSELPSVEKQTRESEQSYLKRKFESIKIEDMREFIKIKDNEVMRGHMYEIAYLAELTSGLQEYFPGFSNISAKLPELQRKLFRSYINRISANESDADPVELNDDRNYGNQNGHVNNPRERKFIPPNSKITNTTLNVEILPAVNRPSVMRDSLLYDVHLIRL